MTQTIVSPASLIGEISDEGNPENQILLGHFNPLFGNRRVLTWSTGVRRNPVVRAFMN